MVHAGNFATSVQALALLFQLTVVMPDRVAGSDNEDEDGDDDDDDDNDGEDKDAVGARKKGSAKGRFYRALYAKLVSAELFDAAAQHSLFLNLVFKAVRSDAQLAR